MFSLPGDNNNVQIILILDMNFIISIYIILESMYILW